jgi:Rps23 Pro-64 3,4-dihydroxylase Tpa1-like proline 4-hydroxylase
MLPPHVIRRDFLPADMASQFVAYALANEGRFAASKVGVGGELRVDPRVRRSMALGDFGPLRDALQERLLPLGPTLTAELRVTPFEGGKIELDMAAHNDGAFYTRHIDTQRGDDQQTMRVLSAVYYFHTSTKAFSGGALRLHAIGGDDAGKYVDLEPAHNTLVVFPSWMSHEVMPVSCPSGRFADSRFSINCWFRKAR